MSTNIEDASRPPKRARAEDEDGGHVTNQPTANVGSAPATQINDSKDLQAIKGTKLDSLTAVLATQPKELHGTIIARSQAMLDLHASIKQRETSHLRFNEPTTLKDPHTGDPLRDESGAPRTVPFIPRAFRKKCPVQSSADVNKDTKIIDALKKGQDLHAEYQKAMTDICKEIGGLEIKLRKEKFQSLFHADAFIYAQALLIAKITLEGSPPRIAPHHRRMGPYGHRPRLRRPRR